MEYNQHPWIQELLLLFHPPWHRHEIVNKPEHMPDVHHSINDKQDLAMSSEIQLSETITLGSPITLECPSPKTSFAVIFEDDGETGYFYGLNLENKKQPVLDALHIYDVRDVLDPNVSVKIEIIWSEDGFKSCLAINGFKHAVFDFESRKAYCRSNYPPPDRKFTKSHKWSDEALDLFK